MSDRIKSDPAELRNRLNQRPMTRFEMLRHVRLHPISYKCLDTGMTPARQTRHRHCHQCCEGGRRAMPSGIQSVAEPVHQIHVFVQHRNDQRALLFPDEVEHVVMFNS